MEKIIFKKSGKIGNFEENGKIYTIKLEVEIAEKNGISWELQEGEYKTLSVCGEIWYMRKFEGGGQIREELEQLLKQNKIYNCKTDLLEELLDYWSIFHLNDLTAGTKKQMKALKKANLLHADYYEQVKYLKEINLYEDRNYRYGSRWLVKPIPERIINRIIEISNKIIK